MRMLTRDVRRALAYFGIRGIHFVPSNPRWPQPPLNRHLVSNAVRNQLTSFPTHIHVRRRQSSRRTSQNPTRQYETDSFAHIPNIAYAGGDQNNEKLNQLQRILESDFFRAVREVKTSGRGGNARVPYLIS